MIVESSYDGVDRGTLKDSISKKIVLNRSRTSNEVILQVLCSRRVNIEILGPSCVSSCLSFRLAIGWGHLNFVTQNFTRIHLKEV